MISNRGQLENIISIASVGFLIVVIMAIFIIMAGGASIRYAPEKSVAFLSLSPGGDLMSEKVTVDVGGQNQEMFVLKAISEYKQGNIKWGDLEDAMKPLLNKERTSLAFAVGEAENPSSLGGADKLMINYLPSGQPYPIAPNIAADYLKYMGGNLREVSFTLPNSGGKIVYVQYCYGDCSSAFSARMAAGSGK
jgi:hypothetical protein